ncbi:unnamed protein product [Paramecium sonneborni]|uniref:C2H2-type domain-containing protein n=1 Tax=Paramecium sonneborni TaxID=65129 RepID=A0A8S1K975_9CILI|nr:unnamed protein product [Paramecium sonneborni]
MTKQGIIYKSKLILFQMILENIQNEQNDEKVQKLKEEFQALIQRIQWKKKKYIELKEIMNEENLMINFFEKGEDGVHQTRRGNNRIQIGKTRKYECKVCKKTYDKYQQLGGHLRKGHPKILCSKDSSFEVQPEEI